MDARNLLAFWPNLSIFAIAFALSALIVIAGWFVRLQVGIPNNNRAVQRVHAGHPPRLGGVGVIIACTFAALLFLPNSFIREYYIILSCSFPIIGLAFCEDIGISIKPIIRLFITFFSSSIYVLISDNIIDHFDINLIDDWSNAYFLYFVFSVIFISSSVQSMNLVDGLNGLCSGISILVTLCLAYIGQAAGAWEFFYISTLFYAAIVGFFVINYPSGSVFLGDFGAYWLGFLLSAFSIYALRQIPTFVTPAMLLIFFWPAFDLGLAIWRRFVARRHLFRPDRMHPHHVALRLVRARLGGAERWHIANSIASFVILLLAAPPMYLGAVYWNDAAAAWTALFVCGVVYLGFYVGAVRAARAGLLRRWARLRRHHGAGARSGPISSSRAPVSRPVSASSPVPAPSGNSY